MPWNQLQIKANAETAESISDYLFALGAQAVTLLDAENQPLLEPAPGETPLWDETWVSGLFSDTEETADLLLKLKILLEDPHLEHRVIPLPDKEWSREWLSHFRPLQFGERLWITPAERQHLVTEPGAVKLILDPGLAFGTGTHPTTELCLHWLARHLKPGQTLIDYGCGSGILALAACKLGASRVIAVDYDPQALEATRENAARNQIAATQLQIVTVNQAIHSQADIVMANILANTLIALAEKLTALVKPQGMLVLSGILRDQIETVTAAYQAGIRFNPADVQDGWACLAGKAG